MTLKCSTKRIQRLLHVFQPIWNQCMQLARRAEDPYASDEDGWESGSGSSEAQVCGKAVCTPA